MRKNKVKSQLRIQNLSWLLLFYFFATGLLQGQQNNLIKNNFKLKNNIEGTAEYQYVVQKKDTLPQGNFEFFHSYEDTSRMGYYYSLMWQGNYIKAEKQGEWNYKWAHLKEGDKQVIKNNRIVKQASGEEFSIQAHFKEGLAQNDWIAMRRLIKNSEPSDTLYYSRASFINERFSKNLTSKNPLISLEGSFDQNGLLNGVWKIKHKLSKELIENRVYQSGVFMDHYFVVGKDTLSVIHKGLAKTNTEESQEDWVELPVSDRYFNLILYTQFGLANAAIVSEDSLFRLIKESNNFFQKTLLSFAYHKEVEIWNVLRDDHKVILPSFKVRKFTYDKVEEKQIKIIQEKYSKAQKRLQDFRSNPQAKLARHASDELKLLSQAMHIYELQLKKLTPLMHVMGQAFFEYIDRKEYLANAAPSIEFLNNISLDDEGIQRDYDFVNTQEYDSLKSISSIQKLLSDIEEDVKKLIEDAVKIVDRYAKQSSLSEKEEKLVQKHDSIISLFNNEWQRSDYNSYHDQLNRKATEQVEILLKNYSQKSLEQKIETLEDNLNCINTYFYLYEYLARMPKTIEDLDELYTRVSLNGFTLTYMEERVKERLYKSYKDIVFRELWRSLNDDLTCENAAIQIEDLQILFVFMKEIREQDTKDLERQLRRVSTFDEAVRIMEIPISQNLERR